MKKKMILNGVQVEVSGNGTSYNFDDGLTKDGDTVSVTTPVRGIYTQEEFDALSEEERNKGLYVVDDGESGGTPSDSGGGEVYSTEEIRIGTWIDGKPLYRSMFSGTFGSLPNWKTFGDASFVDVLVNIRLIINDTNSNYKKIGPDNISAAGINPDKLWSVHFSNYYNNCPFIAICEYTKTTDSEVIA